MGSVEAERLEARYAQARRLAAHVRNNTSDLAPAPMRNDVRVYTDPARHAAERQKLFRQTPIVACLSRELPGAGSYRLFDETGLPIVVVRGADGEVRAFLNICTHRGARLAREQEGSARLFTCWFHGWSFDTQGSLVGVPERERFQGCLEPSAHLIAVPAAERHGIVFVQASPGSQMDIDAHLGSFGDVLAGLDLGKCERVKTGQIPVNANWKYALDTYGEGYHFAALHKQTLAPYFRNDVTVYDRYGPHHRVGFASRDVEQWASKPESEWPVPGPAGIHYLFPNTIIFVGSVRPGFSYTTLFRHFPGEEVGETVTYKTIYAPSGVNSEEYRKEVEAAFDATAHVVATEDYVTAAEGWRNMVAMPEGSTVVYGRQELALQYQHMAIADAIGMPLPAVSA
ncbi:MAG: aromatic ring-hydroxylating dioxygenase subunit alpha [Alphaproteobacteria bacterium]|nr:aromatic ring-hydroxylating dioxygenase subunit alpha [Alphaproteobacteria bacterium]